MRALSRPLLGLVLVSTAAGCSGGSEPPVGDPKIVSFTATPTEVEPGGTVTLSWETTGATSVNIEPRVGLQAASGTIEVTPFITTTYRLTIPGGPSDLSASVEVKIVGGAPRVLSFTAAPRTVNEGEQASLTWTTSDAESVEIQPGIGALQMPNGTFVVTPMVTTTYQLTAVSGDSRSPQTEVTIVVAPAGNMPVVKEFKADPQTVQAGMPVNLTWDVANANQVSLDNGLGVQAATTGMVTVMPTQTTTYNLTAQGDGGQTSASVTVTVLAAGDPEITEFIAMPATILPGGMTTLSWDTNNADGVNIDNGVGNQMAKGMVVVSPAQTTTYTLVATGSGMQVMQQVTVTVAEPNAPVVTAFTAQPAAILTGGSTTLSWTTQNADRVDIDNGGGTALPASGQVSVAPTQSTTYTLTAFGTGGQVMEVVTVNVGSPPPVVVSFNASPASVMAGGMTTLTWSTTDATGVMIDNNVGAQPASGSVMVSPNQTTQYTLTAMGPGGQATAQVSVTVSLPGAPQIVSFEAMPQQISPGGQTTLSWNVTGADTISIDNNVGPVPATGSSAVSPATNTTYTLTAVNTGGQTTAQVNVTVQSTLGDTCTDAFDVTASGTYTGNTLTAQGDYNPGSNGCTGFSAAGPDQVYRVNLQAGDRLQASLQPTGSNWDASLYLVTACSDVTQSCVAGQDNGNPEDIDFTAVSAGTYFIIADGWGTAGGTYDLTVMITPAAIGNDQCGGAIDATAGGSFSGDTSNATDDYGPGGFGGCTGFTAASNDVTYSVTLAAGERLQAALTAAWDASLYVVTDCAMASASCVAGQDNGNPEQVDFTATNAGTYFIIVDGFGSARGTFDLDVTISPPVSGGDVCTAPVMVPSGGGSFQSTTVGLGADYDPGSGAGSCVGSGAAAAEIVYALDLVEGEAVEALADFGAGVDGVIYAVTDCNALTSCVAGADASLGGGTEFMRFIAQTAGTHYLMVDGYQAADTGTHDLTITSYDGDVCADAIPVDFSGQPEWFSTNGATGDYSPGSMGCTRLSSGPDRAYSVFLQAGEQLHAKVDNISALYDPTLYVVTNCNDINGSCLAGADLGARGASEEVAPVVQQSGSVRLIVDTFSTSTGTGELTVEINRGDTCADAYYVPPRDGTFAGTTTNYGADLGTTASGTNSCTGFGQRGKDAVYAVTIPAGDTLNASVTATWDSALYLVSDCSASATTCVVGSDGGDPEDITFTNTTGGDLNYFLVVDSYLDSTANSGNYTLTIDFD